MIYDVIIIGAGFCGLSAALELSKNGKKVLILESELTPGGLASNFEFKDGSVLEKFYHHWFNNDIHITELVKKIGAEENILNYPSKTGLYFNNKIWKLSSPLDLLKFRAISVIDRLRLGLMVLKVRKLKDWKTIENLSIKEWLEPLCGKNAYKVVWEPLVNSKFSKYADQISAVWMWKKLVLRGSTRDQKGKEELLYFKGGFGRLAEMMVEEIRKNGSEIIFNRKIDSVQNNSSNRISSVKIR